MANKTLNSIIQEMDNLLLDIEERGEEIIRVSINDPKNSIFKPQPGEKSYVKVSLCSKCKDCPALKEGKCVNVALFNRMGENCPFGRVTTITGFTKASKNYEVFVNTAKEKFVSSYTIRDSVKHLMPLGDGSLIYLGLAYLNNYCNPFKDKCPGMINDKVIKAEYFTKETVNALLNYRPRDISGNPIINYQKTELPPFIRSLRIRFPDLYNACVKGTDYENRILNINFIGKKAYVTTLKPGNVKINGKIWNWDGTQLTIPGKEFTADMGEDTVVTMIPQRGTRVEVINNMTVDEIHTRFVHE